MSETIRGPGRPPLPEGTRKAAIFSIRLSPDERVLVDVAAAAFGLKASDWARKVLMDALPPLPGLVHATWRSSDGSLTVEGTPEEVGRALGLLALAPARVRG